MSVYYESIPLPTSGAPIKINQRKMENAAENLTLSQGVENNEICSNDLDKDSNDKYYGNSKYLLWPPDPYAWK